MNNEIIVNAERGETRVALLEGSSFTELHIERGSDRNVMGSVILGRVSRVLPGMQAAFVDIGLEKAAFLYAGDYIDTKSQTSGGDGSSPRRRRGNGRSHIQIDAILKEGQEIVVQIAKEPIGTKEGLHLAVVGAIGWVQTTAHLLGKLLWGDQLQRAGGT